MSKDNMEELVDKFTCLLPTLEKRLIKVMDIKIEYNLAPIHFRALALLREFKMLSMSELSNKMFISKQQTTTIVDKLIKYNFADREASKEDRRIIYIKVADKGIDFLNKCQEAAAQDLRKSLRDFTEEDILRLINAIDDIYELTEKLK